MRINISNKSIDIEERDINFIMDSFAVSYTFHSKGVKPDVIVIPMFAKAKTRYGDIDIQFVPSMSEMAIDIIQDGNDIAEIKPEAADSLAIEDAKKQKLIDEVKQEMSDANKLKAANADIRKVIDNIAPDRAPRIPAGPIIEPGQGGLSEHQRDPSIQRQIAADLMPERGVDESKEIEVTVSKSTDGSKKVG